MVPIALTCKQSTNRYAINPFYEIMLVHMCSGCSAFSKNRIAADDNEYSIMRIYENSFDINIAIRHKLTKQGIYILNKTDGNIVKVALYGK